MSLSLGKKVMRQIIQFCLSALLMLFQLTAAGMATPADSATETRKVNPFDVIKIEGNFNVVLVPGSACSLKVTAGKDILPSVLNKNTGTTLSISMKPGTQGSATLEIGIKDIVQISLNINGSLSSAKEIKADNLALNLDGNTGGTLLLNVKMLTFNSTTEKDLVVKGKAGKCIGKLTGDGNTDMSELKVEDMTIEKSDDGDLKIFAHPDLSATMEGTGKITYYGNPKKKIFHIHGNGQIVEGK